MRVGWPESMFVRGCALSALTVLISFAVPPHVGRAQSGPPPLTPLRGLIDQSSINLSGRATDASVDASRHSISADGRFVVMTSNAYDLVPDDWNWSNDVFLRDRMTGTTTRVSVTDAGGETPEGASFGVISANGRHVAFASAAQFTPGDTNGVWDIFVRDLDAGRTVRVSIATDGTQADADSYFPVLSATGRFVAFVSTASNLAAGGAQYQPGQVYVHDRDADGNGVFDEPGAVDTSIVSVSPSGERAADWTHDVRISGDGRFVLFETTAANLDPVVTLGGTNHLYVRDRQAAQTTLVDRAVTGGPSGWGVEYASSNLSDDGRYVTYTSVSPDIVPLDMNWRAQVFRFDRTDNTTGQTVVVSALPDGSLGNASSYTTSVSGDGRYVAFMSTATNLVSPALAPGTGAVVVRDMAEGTFTRIDVLADGSAFDHVYPYNPSISADGTAVAFSSDARNAIDGQFTWNAQHVFVATAFAAAPASASYPMAGGSGSIEVNTLAVSGWNAVSLDGWIVLMDGAGFGAGPRTVNYLVDSNGPGIARDGRIQLGSMVVTIHQEGDGDVTPPVITPTVTGTLHPSGWYTSDITVRWSISDPESEIVSTEGCYDSTFTTDFTHALPYCRAMSHGGSSYESVALRRDTTGPAITITTPAVTTYALNSSVMPAYSCVDGGADIATCAITTGSAPLGTSTPGRKTFTVTAIDRAGNSSTKSVEYIVGTGVCAEPQDSLKAWFRFENDGADALGHLYASPTPPVTLYYAPGIAGQAWQAQGQGYLDAHDGDRLLAWSGLTISAWVRPGGTSGESATIVSKPAQYTVAVFPDRTLRWAFSHTTGFAWVNTGVRLTLGAFTHVAVTYDAGLVNTYVNGALVHTRQLAGVLTNATDYAQSLTIGGRADANAPFWGLMDEVQVFTGALSASDVEAIALAGNGGLCVPRSTTATLTVPPTAGYMSNVPVSASLRDDDDNPIVGRTIAFYTRLSTPGAQPGVATAITDANGRADALVPVQANAILGTYSNGVLAIFDGDVHYTPSQASAAMTVVRATPAIAWGEPSPITYGTPLGAQQFNASANTTGTYSYWPAAGATLPAGTHQLGVTFTPDDLERFEVTTATTMVTVNKATPTVTITGGTYTYDKLPHPAAASVTGVGGEALSPLQVWYGSAQTAPVSAGSYWARAYFAGSANYTSAWSSNVPLVIKKYVPTVQVFGGPYTYDGQQHAATVYVRGAGSDYLSPYGVFYDGWTYTVPVQAGTHTIQVQYNGDYNYEPITVTDLTLVINKASPALSMNAGTRNFNGSPQSVAAWASGVNGASLTPVVVTYDGSSTAPTSIGSYAVVARYDGSANYSPASIAGTLTIIKGTPVITWVNPAGIVYGTLLGAAQLNATGTIPGHFSYSPAAGTLLAAGSLSLNATFVPDDSVNYNTATKVVTLAVAKATPVVTWANPADIEYGAGLSGTQLNATASVPGSFSYSPAAGSVLNVGTRTLSVTFTPSDAGNHNSATASVTLQVLKATPAITWPVPSDITYGMPLTSAQLNAIANTPGTFVYTPAAGVVLDVGPQTVSVTFTPTFSGNYNTATAAITLNVAKATPSVSWPSPAAITYGTALGAAQLNATASVPGTFEYSPAAGTVLNAGSNALSVTFTPDDQTRYGGAVAATTLTVRQKTPSISWPFPQGISYGTPLGPDNLNAAADVAGTFAYTPPAGTILLAGANQPLQVTFVPDDASNYTTASANRIISVSQAMPVLTWPAPESIPYGTAVGAAQYNATANVPGTFVYYPAPGTVLPAGPAWTLRAEFTPDDTANYFSSTKYSSIAVTKVVPVISWTSPAPLVYGTPLGAAELNATASVAGSFTYTPPAGTMLPAGSHTLSVTFTPDNSANYAGGTATVTLNVSKAPVVVSWASPAPIVYGTPLGVSQLNATAPVPGTFTYSPAAGTRLNAGSALLAVSFVPADTANYSGASASTTLTIAKAPLTVAAGNASKPYGAPLPAFSGTLSGLVNGDSAASLAGTLTFSTPATPASAVGAYPVTPSGLSSSNYAITFVNGILSVVQASTAVVAAVSPNPVGLDQPVTFTANVSVVAPGTGSLSGVVQFFDGGTLIASVPLVGGTAGISTSGLVAGSHTLTAAYSGDASFAASSATASFTVQPASATATTIVTSSLNPANAGQVVTFRASVSAPSGGVSGIVEFYDGSTSLGTATLAAGTASLSTASLAAGGHAVSARFLGNAAVPPSLSAVMAQTVQVAGAKPRSSTTTLSASPAVMTLGTEVTLTATVTGSQNKAPSGSVMFVANGAVIGIAPVSTTGSVTAAAVLRTSALPHGTHSLTAVYLADTNYRASAGALKLTVN